MKLRRFVVGVVGAGVLATTAVSGSALAGQSGLPSARLGKNVAATSSGGACYSSVVWPTASNTLSHADVNPHTPPRLISQGEEVSNFFSTRYLATWYMTWNKAGTAVHGTGLLLQGANLYRHTTYFYENAAPRPTATKVGTGWSSFKAIATSNYSIAMPRHAYLYGLNTNGNLYRYAPNGLGYKSYGSFGGFRSFKAMAVISETATYDTLLMTTTAGALYTIRIPVTASPKPVVKLVRKSGWSSFESLIVKSCGYNNGSLVVAVDHNTDSGYQFAFSKANGTATAITSYGKIPATFNGINHAAWTWYTVQLTGE